MEVSVVVPFRPDPRVHGTCRLVDGAPREQIWGWLRRRWEILHPGYEIVECEPAGGVMNRAQARNRGAEDASGDILVFADADVAAEWHQIHAAVTEIVAGASWVVAYREYIQLDGPDTRDLLAKPPDSGLKRPRVARWATTESNAGMLVVTRAAFELVRGYDERFVKWGWEDWAIANALETLCGPQRRTNGFVLHLHHPRDRDRSKKQGQKLFSEYDAAHGDPDAMFRLVDESAKARQ